MSDLIPAVLSTFGLAFFWFIGAIPAGMALNLPPLVAGLTVWTAYVAGVLLILLAGTSLRARLFRRLNISLKHNPDKLFWKAWDRYGLIGLALLSPVTVGAQAGALIGLALGVAPRRLGLAMILAALIWCAGIMLVTLLGLTTIQT